MNADIVGARVARNTAIVFAEANGLVLSLGDVIAVRLEQQSILAIVAIAADQLLNMPENAVTGHVLAVGRDSPGVASTLAKRDRDALDLARGEAGPSTRITSAHWSDDNGSIEIQVEGVSTDHRCLSERLSRLFRASVRISQVAD